MQGLSYPIKPPLDSEDIWPRGQQRSCENNCTGFIKNVFAICSFQDARHCPGSFFYSSQYLVKAVGNGTKQCIILPTNRECSSYFVSYTYLGETEHLTTKRSILVWYHGHQLSAFIPGRSPIQEPTLYWV